MSNYDTFILFAAEYTDLADAEVNEGLEQAISECCAAMLQIKQRVGQAMMNVMTKGLEFVRIIYGGPGSNIVIVVLYI